MLLAVFWYGIVPVAGAFIERRQWRFFRRRFGELRLKPCLDYPGLVSGGEGEYRFCGVFESLSAGGILWIRSGELTVQVDLAAAKTYMFPNTGGADNFPAFDPGAEVPEKIRWDRISGLTGDVRIFAGGALVTRENRRVFASLPEKPLLVIFYEGSEKALSIRAVRAGRHRNEFINFLTPYAFILGAFSQILIALTYLTRPAYRVTLVSSLVAAFIPLFPWIPPGILFTLVYRRLWFEARMYRAFRDLARLPMAYIPRNESRGILPGGEIYAVKTYEILPSDFYEKIPFLLPPSLKRKNSLWHVFGSLGEDDCPGEPMDDFAVRGILPGESEILARQYTRKAYALEIIAWIFLLAGTGVNIFFICLILMLFQA